MWPNWVFILMAMLSAFLFGVLCYPMAKELNALVANKWQARTIRRNHAMWQARCAARMREVLR